jgi:hypothetical protein
MAIRASSTVGLGLCFSRATADTTCPGVQNPHCGPSSCTIAFCTGCHVIEHHRAVAALGMIAAELGAGETELVAQRMNEGFVREHVDWPIAAIDVERNQPRHRTGGLRQRITAAPDDHVTCGRHGNARGNHAFDEIAPRRANALRRRRAAGRRAGVLAMDIARGSLVVLWHDWSSLFRYDCDELAMAGSCQVSCQVSWRETPLPRFE